jgi:hypothetical protein
VSAEFWGALGGLAVYAGMKAIDRLFRVVDHVLDERLDNDQEDTDEPDP